jgi:hypothetical protein
MIEISITLGIANFNNGFLNIPIAYDLHFGEHNLPINVYLGNWNVAPNTAHINRNANPNRTPRIMIGIDYTNWVQANYQIGQNITVGFNDPLHQNSILIQ